jgi:hypothetical protein
MPRKLFAEILEDIRNAGSDTDTVVELLREHNTIMLRQLLLAAFDPSIKFDVVIPTYTPIIEADGYAANSLYVEYRRLYIFTDTYNKVNSVRKKALLAQILESIDPSDSTALIHVIQKDLGRYGLTKEIVNQAFPNLIKE